MKDQERFYTYTLSNGLRVILQQTDSPVSYAGFAINAGTRDEAADKPGMAHFVEHMLFKGTSKRKAWHILNRMEKVGGDLDAYTNKEETVIYSVFLKEHLARAVELMADLVFHSIFPQTEIVKETDVIIGEIQSYEDSPSELIFDGFEDMIFSGHPLGRDILGDAEHLKTYTTQDALDFYNRFYVPGNVVFFATGRHQLPEIVKLLERNMMNVIPKSLSEQRLSPDVYQPQRLVSHRGTHQAHVMIGGRGYDGSNRKKVALYMLSNLLGGPGMNSKLNIALREKRGLVYDVEANASSYTDAGTFSIYFGCELEDVKRCVDLTMKELKNLCEKPLTTYQMASLRKQLVGQLGVSQDNSENNALGMAKTFLHYDRFVTMQETYERIASITPQELLEVAQEVFSEQNISSLIFQ